MEPTPVEPQAGDADQEQNDQDQEKSHDKSFRD
jgi:hypothetical protein